jgi:hypothetical protein
MISANNDKTKRKGSTRLDKHDRQIWTKLRRDTSPAPMLGQSEHTDVETDPAQPAPSMSPTAVGAAPHHGEADEGWKKVEKKRKGEEKQK